MSHSPRLPAPRNNKGETHLKTPSDSRAESQVSISQILSKLLRRPKRPMMDFDYYYKSSHVPAFGSWDWNQDLPFTQCFESARQAGLLRYRYSEDRDLYVAGDLYENDVVTPAMIVVPRRRAKTRHPPVEEAKEQSWVASEVKEPASPAPAIQRPTPKPVDEDLYKISPELLYAKTKKKRGLGFFSSCLLPTCVL